MDVAAVDGGIPGNGGGVSGGDEPWPGGFDDDSSEPLLTVAQLAASMRVSTPAVYRWIARGLPSDGSTPTGSGLYRLSNVVAWRRKTTRPRTAEKMSDGGEQDGYLDVAGLRQFISDPTGRVLTYGQAKAAREQFGASIAATKAAMARAELVRADEARAAWSSALGVFARAMDAMPSRAAPRIVAAMAEAMRAGGADASAFTPDIARAFTAACVSLLADELRIVRRSIVTDAVFTGRSDDAEGAYDDDDGDTDGFGDDGDDGDGDP